MRAVLQRVSEASVTAEGRVSGAIGPGLLVLLGVARGDTDADVPSLAEKILNLRIFSDVSGQMNLSVRDTGGAVLVVSQFTLLGDCRKGRRPSFVDAAPLEEAKRLYGAFVAEMRSEGIVVQEGVFRAHMQVHLVNDGPVTFVLDTQRS